MATALEQCGIVGPKLQAMLEGAEKDIMKRIDLNLRRLEVARTIRADMARRQTDVCLAR